MSYNARRLAEVILGERTAEAQALGKTLDPRKIIGPFLPYQMQEMAAAHGLDQYSLAADLQTFKYDRQYVTLPPSTTRWLWHCEFAASLSEWYLVTHHHTGRVEGYALRHNYRRIQTIFVCRVRPILTTQTQLAHYQLAYVGLANSAQLLEQVFSIDPLLVPNGS